MSKKLTKYYLATALGTGLIMPVAAQAEEMSDEAFLESSESDTMGGSEIVVTGSRIRGAAPVGSAVLSVGRDDFESQSSTTTSQLLEKLPQVSNLGISESSRLSSGGIGNGTYSQGLNIHGIGGSATLMLIDGRRLVPQGTAGSLADVNTVPSLALERIELVADGASALYGADAVAGVANLILRRRFEGVQASATYGIADDYSQWKAGIIAGTSWGSGNAMIAYDYSGHSNLSSADRDYVRADLTKFGGSDFSSTQCNPGNLIVDGTSYAIPAGGLNAGNVDSLVANTVNTCDNYRVSDIVPEMDRHSFVVTVDQDVTGTLSISATGFAVIRNGYFNAGLNALTFTVPETNAFYVTPVDGEPQTVSYAFSQLPGNDLDFYSKTYQGTVAAQLQLPRSWQAEAAFTYGYSDEGQPRDQAIYQPAFATALVSSDPATAFNPYGGQNSQSVFDAIGRGSSGSFIGNSSQWTLDAQLDGPLFDIAGGTVRAALGYQHQDIHTNNFALLGARDAITRFQTMDVDRVVNSVFAELSVPVVGPDNSMPGIERLTFNAAVRYDKYSDFGSTTNPKFGVTWEVVDGFKLRGSYGTSFQAPSLPATGASGTTQIATYVDPSKGGASVQGLLISGGNEGLKPISATTYSFGADFDFGYDVRFAGSIGYFNVAIDDQVVSVAANGQILSQEDLYAGTGVIIRNPSEEAVADFISRFPLDGGVLPDPVELIIDARSRNFGRTKVEGIDFMGSVAVPVGSDGTFTGGVSGTYFLEFARATVLGSPLLSERNTILWPQTFRARTYLTWDKDPYDVGAYVNYTGSYDNDLVTPVQKVDDYATLDMHFGLRVSGGNSLGEDIRFALDVKNVLDSDPPFVNIGPSAFNPAGFDATSASALGRQILFGVTATF